MRALLLALPLGILTLWPGSGNAGDARPLQIAAISDSEKLSPLTDPNHEMYRGYYLDVSQIAGRWDFAKMVDALRGQLDTVENIGLSPRMLNFFHTVPILVDDAACLDNNNVTDNEHSDDKAPNRAPACFGSASLLKRASIEPTVVEDGKWSNPDPVALAEDTDLGVVQVRPMMLDGPYKDPRPSVILHEMLHAYHHNMMPRGFRNSSILFYYNQAQSKKLYPADAYVMTNEMEFFAVTASVILSNRADGGITPEDIKQKQPDYFKYLSWLLEIGLDGAPSVSPVASTN